MHSGICNAGQSVLSESEKELIRAKEEIESWNRELEFVKAGGKVYSLYKPFQSGEILHVTKQVLSLKS